VELALKRLRLQAQGARQLPPRNLLRRQALIRLRPLHLRKLFFLLKLLRLRRPRLMVKSAAW